MKEDIKKPVKEVSLTEKDERILLNRPDQDLINDERAERESERQRISNLLKLLSFEPNTIVSLDNKPAGRAARDDFSKNPFDTTGSQHRGGRFNFRPSDEDGLAKPVLYVADSKKTALTEVTRNLKSKIPFVYWPVNLKLQKVLDLRSESSCAKNGIDMKELLRLDVDYFQDILKISAYSQEIGARAYEHPEIEGIAYPSVRNSEGWCVALFTEKLLIGSFVEGFHPEGDERIFLLQGTRADAVEDDEE